MATATAATAASSTAATTAATAGAAAGATAATGFTLASLLPSAATMANVATGLSVISSVRQGQAAENAGKVAADNIKNQAVNREVNRRRRLVSSLASQNATRAASGIALAEGSSKSMFLEDARIGEGSLLVDRAGAGSAASSAIAAGRSRRNTSFINAGASLLSQFDRTQARG